MDVLVMSETTEQRPDTRMVGDIAARLGRLGWITGAVGAVVVFIAIGFLIPVFIDPDERTDLGLLNLPFIVAYLLISSYVVTRHMRRHFLQTVDWIVERREPDADEHRQTLRLAMHGVTLAGGAWVLAAVLFAAFNAVAHSWGFAAVAGATIWLGGETTCALLYLLRERILRRSPLAHSPLGEPRGRLLQASACDSRWPGSSAPACRCSACSSSRSSA
jgi:hypothetical protein